MTDFTIDVTLGSPLTANGVYDVTAYGAAGDGSTDDTTYIQAAFDACIAAGGGEVYFPPLTYRTTASLEFENTALDEYYHINAGQAIIIADSGLAGPILHIGSTTAQAANTDLTGGTFGMSARDWTSTSGVKLSNLYNSHLRDFKAYWCEKGLELSAASTADGCSYNTICFRHMSDCLYGVYIENDGSGWCNENTFYGDGRVSYSTSLVDVDCSGGAGFYAQAADYGGTSTYLLNSLTVLGMSLEFSAGNAYSATNGHAKPPAVDVDLTFSSFAGIRTEGFDTTYNLTDADSATNASPCVLSLKSIGSGASEVNVTDHGIKVGDQLYITGVETNCLGLNGNDYAVEAEDATTVDITVDMSGEGGNGTTGTASVAEWLRFGANSQHNIWYGGRRSFSGDRLPATQRLRCNFLGQRENVLTGGNTDYPVLALRTNSSGYKALAIYNAANDNEEFYIGSDGVPVFVPTAAPGTPAEGMLYYDSSANKLKVYTGAAWETITSA